MNKKIYNERHRGVNSSLTRSHKMEIVLVLVYNTNNICIETFDLTRIELGQEIVKPFIPKLRDSKLRLERELLL